MTTALFAVALASPAGEFETSIPMSRKGTATYYVQGSITGFGAVEFMVDTGAGYTTINEETLAALQSAGLAKFVTELTGMMADGTRRTIPIYRVSSLTLGNTCVLHNIEAAVFPRKTRLILGLSALEKTSPFVFSTNPPRLDLSNCTGAGI
ncbi:MAG: retropepsin-like aspartic protease [Gammaproteobacteria bacterium]|nr:retropepsin-like aspartic protease [Gammaproteobacteria bacterium]